MSVSPPSSDRAAPNQASRWFSEEVQPHASALKGYIRRAFPTLHDADDVVQESYLRILRQRATEPIRSTRAFLFTTAQRLALDWMRRRQRSPVNAVEDLAALEVPIESPLAHESLGQEERIALLIEAIDALPSRCREVVVLRKLQCLSQRETAARLEISEKGVEAQLARGIERCRHFLRARGIHHDFRHEL